MDSLVRDFRYGARMLMKSPGFSFLAIMTLALGIGANVAIFSTVNSLLLRPHPFPQLDRLILVNGTSASQSEDDTRLAPADVTDFENQARGFTELAVYREGNFTLTGMNPVSGVNGAAVSANFFRTLGVEVASGRPFSDGDDTPGNDQEVIVSHGYWVRQCGSDPQFVGKTLQINGRAHTVIGIMPANFNYPLGNEIWVPLALQPEETADRLHPALHILGRLKPGYYLGEARAEARAFATHLSQQYPVTNFRRSLTLLPLREEQWQYTAPMFLTLQAAAGFVLLLACANLVNLQFARLIGRQRELAVRTALGADWKRIAQVLLSESFLLSLLAGTLSVTLSLWTVRLIRNAIPFEISKWIAGWEIIRVDLRVLGFALLVTVLVGLIFGAAIAIRASRLDPNRALKEGSGGASTSKAKERLRDTLVVTQVVLAMVLLVGAGLMVKGFLHLVTVYQGLQPARVGTAEISLPEKDYSDVTKVAMFYERLIREAANLPAVESVGIADNLPASNVGNDRTPFTIEGRPVPKVTETPSADRESISAEFLRTMRIPLVQGRFLSDRDDRTARLVAVISQSMAERFWPAESPVGQRLKLGDLKSVAPWVTIVGIVGDVKQNWWDPNPHPIIYLPYQQAPQRGMNIVVRSFADSMSTIAALRAQVQSIDPQIPLRDLQPMEGVIADALSPVRIIGILMAAFGAIALALSAIGVYGVLAQSVAQRMREFGIRIALGAKPSDLLKLVVGQAVKLSAISLAVALPLSLILARLLGSLLFGVVALKVSLLVGLAVLLVLVAVAAGFLPARRASRVDPIVALRYE
jgi:putative ABC transport system permease protein